jgi:hypothetical protein
LALCLFLLSACLGSAATAAPSKKPAKPSRSWIERFPAQERWAELQQPASNSSSSVNRSPSVAADVALVVVYGALGCFFVYRGVVARNPSSFGLAISLPLGWMVLAGQGLQMFESAQLGKLLRWGGVGWGVYLLWSVTRHERGK